MGMFSGKRILVTGGAGFIGSHLADYLLSNDAEKVVVLDDLSTGKLKNIGHHKNNSRFLFIQGTITELDTCLRASKDMDIILHHAALGSVPRSVENPMRTNEVNVNGFVNILYAAKEMCVKKFVYASSSSVYGDDLTFPKTELRTGNLLSPYAVSKHTNEKYAQVFSSLYGIQTIGFRYFNVFGERQDPNGPYAAVIPKFITALLAGKAGEIYGTGKNTRDFTYIANVVKANELAILSDINQKATVMNIACGGTISVNAIYDELTRLLKTEHLKPVYKPERKGEIKDSFADISLANETLGYLPQTTVLHGLKETLEWYKSRN